MPRKFAVSCKHLTIIVVHSAYLGSVDKVDSQLTGIVIQDCFWGGSFGSRFDDGQGVGVFRAIRDRDWWQERSAAGGSPTGAGWRVLDRAHGCSLA